MTAGGSVIINGSAGWVQGIPGNTVYAASKAALRSFARTWTAELAGHGIRVPDQPRANRHRHVRRYPRRIPHRGGGDDPGRAFRDTGGDRHCGPVPGLSRLQLCRRHRRGRQRQTRSGLTIRPADTRGPDGLRRRRRAPSGDVIKEMGKKHESGHVPQADGLLPQLLRFLDATKSLDTVGELTERIHLAGFGRPPPLAFRGVALVLALQTSHQAHGPVRTAAFGHAPPPVIGIGGASGSITGSSVDAIGPVRPMRSRP
jgi:hypothetical protein